MDKKPNQLIHGKSPYLLQHAYNPVNWFPWNDTAFEKAKRENKPIFLSIGYSTCHWCHVMERESFEDDEVAELLNQNFIAIKVDREERPDVDQIYMSVCQAVTGSGGWPLTVIMTADKLPFFVGTYFPKKNKWGRPGLLEILSSLHREWVQNKAILVKNAAEITHSLQRPKKEALSAEISFDALDLCYSQLKEDFDATYGGFGHAPKFPIPHNLMFLMRYWRLTGEKQALIMVEKTLDAMRKGGIYDHVGYGFSRYSTDEKWLVPHFEKMSYDNALLCYTYLEAYQCTTKNDFSEVARQILDYVLRDMTSPDGGIYSAEDADSEGVEGKFYVWSRDEILEVLGLDAGTMFCQVYDVTDKGNFEGNNILHYINKDLEAIALKNHMSCKDLLKNLDDSRRKLYTVREKRVHPFKDDKILTAWNGLMIAALAKGATVLDCEEYRIAAERAVKFINDNLLRKDGRLLARFRDGEAAYLAYLEDYAFLMWGVIELFESTQKPEFLQTAIKLGQEMIRLFWDHESGGFYYYGSDSEKLIIRPKEIYDGAIPSGNSVAAYAMLRLARITDNSQFASIVEKLMYTFWNTVKHYPKAYTYFLLAGYHYLTSPQYIAVVGEKHNADVLAMWKEAANYFMPETIVGIRYSNHLNDYDDLPFLKDKVPVDGKATAYVCENFTCQKPVNDLNELKNILTIMASKKKEQ